MRIIEWNCQGAFRLKTKEIFELKPDILIVLECETKEKLQFGRLIPEPNDFLWYGDTGKKGIGIFSFSKYKFRILKEFNPKFRYFVPLEVTDGTNSFLLFAIWAMDNKQNPLARYVGQIWLAINYYKEILPNGSILIGDFNSNQIWDEKERVGNHTDVVNLLSELSIESLYHKQENEKQGQESLKTFFMHRNLKKSYHIDYIFASQNIVRNGYRLSVENPEKWIDKSDHVPLVLDITELKSKTGIKHTCKDFTARHINTINEETKRRYSEEILAIEKLAEQLDMRSDENEGNFELVDKIEILKQIDKLAMQLK